jgi:prolipoprotein diacylglyceryltransferase
MVALINAALDRFVRPEIRLGSRGHSSFTMCGCAGLVLAVALTFILFLPRGLSGGVMATIAVAAVATFFVLTYATKVITGSDFLVYYHHMIAILAVTALVVRALGGQLLAYLDVTVLAVGLTLCFVRVGCLMVGCCHGRPSALGARYRAAHAHAGFPSWYVGVRLFPVQALEAVAVLTITAVGTGIALRGGPPGRALVFYVVAYGLARFGLEFLRGDGRPHLAGFSHAQWTSLVLVAVVALGADVGVLPTTAWAWALPSLGFILGTMVVVHVGRAARRQSGASYRLFQAQHIREIAEAMERFAEQGPPGDPLTTIQACRTSVGLVISKSRIEIGSAPFATFTLSLSGAPLTTRVARRLSTLILRLRGSRPGNTFSGEDGTFHLITPAIS